MTTEIDRLRAELDRSPGWQRIREATREGKWNMETEYFIEYCGYWQGERDKFAGPFASVEDAKEAVKELEILLDCDFIPPGRSARDSKIDKRYGVVMAAHVDLRDFRAFANPDNDNETPLLDISKIRNLKIRRALGLAPRPGPKSMLSDPETASFVLGADSREQIAAIRSARPELTTDTDVVRYALRVVTSALDLNRHDPAVFERLENARLDALEDEAGLKAYRAEHGDDAPDPLAK